MVQFGIHPVSGKSVAETTVQGATDEGDTHLTPYGSTQSDCFQIEREEKRAATLPFLLLLCK